MSTIDPERDRRESGMTETDFKIVQDVAEQMGVVIIVRNTNQASTPLIAAGCPGKGMDLSFLHTGERTGVVTAVTPDEVRTARNLGYFVLDADLVARGYWKNGDRFSVNGSEMLMKLDLSFRSPHWRLEKGQIIDPKQLKPVVGDYDLHGVAEVGSLGRNLALATNYGELVRDFNSPLVRKVSGVINSRLDQPRILHGAQDQYAGFRGGATAFFPSRVTLHMPDETAVELVYAALGRKTMAGRYQSRLDPSVFVIPGSGMSQPAAETSRVKSILRNQDAMAILGQALGIAIQRIGDIGIQNRVRTELETTRAGEIRQILSRGEGVLVIIRLQEWILPDFNGMRARTLLEICLKAGADQQDALRKWALPSYKRVPPDGWQAVENYVWIDPNA
jgi:hypothetical protein